MFMYHRCDTSGILCIAVILSCSDRKIWKNVEASCHVTNYVVLWFDNGLLILSFYVLACYLCCFVKGEYFNLREVCRQIVEPVTIPVLKGRVGKRKEKCSDTDDGKFIFYE